jgi:hypothetical protein
MFQINIVGTVKICTVTFLIRNELRAEYRMVLQNEALSDVKEGLYSGECNFRLLQQSEGAWDSCVNSGARWM